MPSPWHCGPWGQASRRCPEGIQEGKWAQHPDRKRGLGGTSARGVSSVQLGRSAVSNSGLQHTRPPCPSPAPGVYSKSCLSSRWCHPAISSSVVPFSFCLQSFPASGSFQMSQFFTSGAKVLEFQLQHQSFQWIFRTDFLYYWLVGCPCNPRDSQASSPTPFKSMSSLGSAFFIVQVSHPYVTTGGPPVTKESERGRRVRYSPQGVKGWNWGQASQP